MARGGFPNMMGGGNMQQLARQAQKLQQQMELISITIKPEAVDPDDVEMLQDLIMAAVNEALRAAGDAMENEMGKMTGGLSMPGLF